MKAYFGFEDQGEGELVLWTSTDPKFVDDSDDSCDHTYGLVRTALPDYQGLSVGAAEQYHLIELEGRSVELVLDEVLPKLKAIGFLFSPKINELEGVQQKWDSLVVDYVPPQTARKADWRLPSSDEAVDVTGARLAVGDGNYNVRVYDLEKPGSSPEKFRVSHGFHQFHLPVDGGILAGARRSRNADGDPLYGELSLVKADGPAWVADVGLVATPAVSPDGKSVACGFSGGVVCLDMDGREQKRVGLPSMPWMRVGWDEGGLVAYDSKVIHVVDAEMTLHYPEEFSKFTYHSSRLAAGHGLVVAPSEKGTAVFDYHHPDQPVRVLPPSKNAFPLSGGSVLLRQPLTGILDQVSVIAPDGKVTQLGFIPEASWMDAGKDHFVATRGRDIWVQRFDSPAPEKPPVPSRVTPSDPPVKGGTMKVPGKVSTDDCKRFLASEFPNLSGWKRVGKRKAGDAVEREFVDKTGSRSVTVVERNGELTHRGAALRGPEV